MSIGSTNFGQGGMEKCQFDWEEKASSWTLPTAEAPQVSQNLTWSFRPLWHLLSRCMHIKAKEDWKARKRMCPTTILYWWKTVSDYFSVNKFLILWELKPSQNSTQKFTTWQNELENRSPDKALYPKVLSEQAHNGKIFRQKGVKYVGMYLLEKYRYC